MLSCMRIELPNVLCLTRCTWFSDPKIEKHSTVTGSNLKDYTEVQKPTFRFAYAIHRIPYEATLLIDRDITIEDG